MTISSMSTRKRLPATQKSECRFDDICELLAGLAEAASGGIFVSVRQKVATVLGNEISGRKMLVPESAAGPQWRAIVFSLRAFVKLFSLGVPQCSIGSRRYAGRTNKTENFGVANNRLLTAAARPFLTTH